ncbi:hypothetical protein CPB83DRAFT_415276 [Crepidotus variabilis]|uniref:Uncharacterized protein n=1 Tax=Crepidotus variabilis TaxID=179855 RepID=A0A9P6ERH6_9AGAR|nr:hypothetical protein CPB83DRAFT_415276 [Crepidotus variabilis]
MATPSSSATSPSPPMAYLHHLPAPQQSLQVNISDTFERDQRKKAIDKFLARAEISMVTRRLRAQLAYASYKATHNIPHVSFRDLEAQSQSQTASFSRTVAAKRKAVGATNHYSSPSVHGSSSVGAGSLRRGGSSSMAPPTSVSSPRPYPSSVSSVESHSNMNEIASSHRNTSQAPNLYASILAPPVTKLARTIHNPNDPPVPAPERPTQTPKSSRASKTSPRNDPSRPAPKAKQSTKNAKATASPDRRRKKPSSGDKRKTKRRSDDMEVDGEMDMKAAATLTSLLLHNRPSIGSASSPRSSIDGSEVGSAYSYPQFHQSSTRNTSQQVPPISAAPSTSTLVAESSFRSITPPPSGTPKQHTSTTPRAAPTDSEAANLMLFLATSPSPVRPTTTNKEKDSAAYRILGGHPGPLRSKGRVLFPSNAATADRGVEPQDSSIPTAGSPPRTSTLARGIENSFSSSISSIGPEFGSSSRTDLLSSSQGSATVVGSPSLTPSGSLSQLLPPAPLPLPTAPNSPAGQKGDRNSNPSPRSSQIGLSAGATMGNPGPAPVPLDFNFHDFINASPSPFAPAPVAGRSNIGLRADVGRKLFEEEQMRHLQAAANASRHEERTLGAGIDLVHS